MTGTDDRKPVAGPAPFSLRLPADLRAALALFLLVRLPWILLLGSSTGLVPLGHGARAMPALDGPVFAQVWLRWDSGWYVRIIREGLAASHCAEPGGVCEQASISFLPGYPMSIRGLMELGLSFSLASWVLNAVCLVLALWGLRRLAALTLGGEAPSRAAWVLLAFPTTLFFTAGYAEALFAASSIWAMVFVTRGQALPAALALAASAMSRPHGIVLVACVVLVSLLRRRFKLALVVTLIAAAVFGAYLGWQYAQFGDPLAFLHARKAWITPEPALVKLLGHWRRVVAGEQPLTGWQDFASVPLLLVAALWSLRRLGLEYALFCLLLVALPLAQGQVWGMSRAALGAFPIFLMFASVGPRLRRPLAFLGLSLASVNAFLFINGMFVS